TGLGARALFGDEELVPLKGQLVVLVPQADVNYGTVGGSRNPAHLSGIGIHMMPRNDGIALGGTAERGVWTMEPNEVERKAVVEGHMDLFAAMHPARPGVHARRIETPADAPPLESHFNNPS